MVGTASPLPVPTMCAASVWTADILGVVQTSPSHPAIHARAADRQVWCTYHPTASDPMPLGAASIGGREGRGAMARLHDGGQDSQAPMGIPTNTHPPGCMCFGMPWPPGLAGPPARTRREQASTLSPPTTTRLDSPAPSGRQVRLPSWALQHRTPRMTTNWMVTRTASSAGPHCLERSGRKATSNVRLRADPGLRHLPCQPDPELTSSSSTPHYSQSLRHGSRGRTGRPRWQLEAIAPNARKRAHMHPRLRRCGKEKRHRDGNAPTPTPLLMDLPSAIHHPSYFSRWVVVGCNCRGLGGPASRGSERAQAVHRAHPPGPPWQALPFLPKSAGPPPDGRAAIQFTHTSRVFLLLVCGRQVHTLATSVSTPAGV